MIIKQALSRRDNPGLSSRANVLIQVIEHEDRILIRLERWKGRKERWGILNKEVTGHGWKRRRGMRPEVEPQIWLLEAANSSRLTASENANWNSTNRSWIVLRTWGAEKRIQTLETFLKIYLFALSMHVCVFVYVCMFVCLYVCMWKPHIVFGAFFTHFPP